MTQAVGHRSTVFRRRVCAFVSGVAMAATVLVGQPSLAQGAVQQFATPEAKLAEIARLEALLATPCKPVQDLMSKLIRVGNLHQQIGVRRLAFYRAKQEDINVFLRDLKLTSDGKNATPGTLMLEFAKLRRRALDADLLMEAPFPEGLSLGQVASRKGAQRFFFFEQKGSAAEQATVKKRNDFEDEFSAFLNKYEARRQEYGTTITDDFVRAANAGTQAFVDDLKQASSEYFDLRDELRRVALTGRFEHCLGPLSSVFQSVATRESALIKQAPQNSPDGLPGMRFILSNAEFFEPITRPEFDPFPLKLHFKRNGTLFRDAEIELLKIRLKAEEDFTLAKGRGFRDLATLGLTKLFPPEKLIDSLPDGFVKDALASQEKAFSKSSSFVFGVVKQATEATAPIGELLIHVANNPIDSASAVGNGIVQIPDFVEKVGQIRISQIAAAEDAFSDFVFDGIEALGEGAKELGNDYIDPSRFEPKPGETPEETVARLEAKLEAVKKIGKATEITEKILGEIVAELAGDRFVKIGQAGIEFAGDVVLDSLNNKRKGDQILERLRNLKAEANAQLNPPASVTPFDDTQVLVEDAGGVRTISDATSGSRSIVDAEDGTRTIITADGGTTTVLPNPDGSSTIIGESGEVTTVLRNPDGSQTIVDANGNSTQIATNPDGTQSVVDSESGTQTIIDAQGGTRTTVGEDGTQTIIDTNTGDRTIIDPEDGTRTIISTDGTKTIVGPDGTQTVVNIADDATVIDGVGGTRRIVDEANGTTTVIEPDGTRTVIDIDTGAETVVLPNGRIITKDPLTGQSTFVDPNGTRTIVDETNGTRTVVRPDGSTVVFDDITGRQTFTDADGQTVVLVEGNPQPGGPVPDGDLPGQPGNGQPGNGQPGNGQAGQPAGDGGTPDVPESPEAKVKREIQEAQARARQLQVEQARAQQLAIDLQKRRDAGQEAKRLFDEADELRRKGDLDGARQLELEAEGILGADELAKAPPTGKRFEPEPPTKNPVNKDGKQIKDGNGNPIDELRDADGNVIPFSKFLDSGATAHVFVDAADPGQVIKKGINTGAGNAALKKQLASDKVLEELGILRTEIKKQPNGDLEIIKFEDGTEGIRLRRLDPETEPFLKDLTGGDKNKQLPADVQVEVLSQLREVANEGRFIADFKLDNAFVRYGPDGPRAGISDPGNVPKIKLGETYDFPSKYLPGADPNATGLTQLKIEGPDDIAVIQLVQMFDDNQFRKATLFELGGGITSQPKLAGNFDPELIQKFLSDPDGLFALRARNRANSLSSGAPDKILADLNGEIAAAQDELTDIASGIESQLDEIAEAKKGSGRAGLAEPTALDDLDAAAKARLARASNLALRASNAIECAEILRRVKSGQEDEALFKKLAECKQNGLGVGG